MAIGGQGIMAKGPGLDKVESIEERTVMGEKGPFRGLR